MSRSSKRSRTPAAAATVAAIGTAARSSTGVQAASKVVKRLAPNDAEARKAGAELETIEGGFSSMVS